MSKEREDFALFREAVKDVRLLRYDRVQHPAPKPRPTSMLRREARQVLANCFSDHYLPTHPGQSGEELSYLRSGHAPAILRKLRRGNWAIQDRLDLHGMTVAEARSSVADFLSHCRMRGVRCVCIIHGKGYGSRNWGPVLKTKLGSWLMQYEEVIAYAQAPRGDGGSGAVVVLLKAG